MTTQAAWDVGDKITFSATFQVDDVDTDPTTVTFAIIGPALIVTRYTYGTGAEIVKDATGQYHVDWSATQSGTHFYKWIGTGSAQAVEERALFVQPSHIPNPSA